MNTKHVLRKAVLGATAALLLTAPAAMAATEVANYPPRVETLTFSDPDEWTARSLYGGLCLQTLTCPILFNTFETTNGAGGPNDGFIRTQIRDVTGVASNARGIWESRAFKYRGVKNQRPQIVRFTISRSTDLTPLISLQGTARYDVDFIDITKGGRVANTIIKDRNLTTTKGFTSEGPFPVSRNALQIGHKYYVRITSKFNTTTQVLNGGFTAYDDVRLYAKRKTVKKKSGKNSTRSRNSRNGRG